MSKAICNKHEWGYDVAEGCPWCPPKPRTRVYRKGEAVTDVLVGMALRDALGKTCRVVDLEHDTFDAVWRPEGVSCTHRVFDARKYCTYAEDFEAPEPAPPRRVYRKGDKVTDVFAGMRLVDRNGDTFEALTGDHGGTAILRSFAYGDRSASVSMIRVNCTYAEDFEAP